MTATLTGCRGLNPLSGGQATETVSQQYDVGNSPAIILNTAAGDINVTASNSNSVSIRAEKRAPSAADLQQMDVSFTNDSSGVRAEYRSKSNADRRSVTFDISAPKNSRLQLQSGNGSINTDGFSGDVAANSGNGSTSIKNQDGRVDLRAGNGSITAQGRIKGPSSATAGNGSVTVDLPADSKLHVNATTTNGGITTQFGLSTDEGNGAKLNATLGDGSDGFLSLLTANGSIAINKR
jgi:hypothetical protein